MATIGTYQPVEQVQEAGFNPILKANYNLWELSYTSENPNNDYIFIFPINDRCYHGSFYSGDTIYYNQSQPNNFYTLTESEMNGWLAYEHLDSNADGIVSMSDMLYRTNRLFEVGEVKLGNPLFLAFLCVAYVVYKIVKKKR